VGQDDPVSEAKERGADLVQIFLGDPQGWKKPPPHPGAQALHDAGIPFVVHAPYLVNVATMNNKIRIPSRKILAQHAQAAAGYGARALIVHGGHVNAGDDIGHGIDNWRKTFERETYPLPILIENTAGGDNACCRRFDNLARLWDAIGDYDVGFCLDTCHAHAAGEDLVGIVERVRSITGRIDLVHCNDSKDPFGSGRDRHENLGAGTIDVDLIVAAVSAADAPVVCETPVEGQADDITLVRSRVGG
jgi:deoxyribonuclease-4